jgi:hypothetical protein
MMLLSRSEIEWCPRVRLRKRNLYAISVLLIAADALNQLSFNAAPNC